MDVIDSASEFDVRAFKVTALTYILNLVQCNLTKLTTTSLAVKRFMSLKQLSGSTCLAEKQSTSLAVKRSTSLAGIWWLTLSSS